MSNCQRHTFDQVEDECRSCAGGFCGECLVYTNGAQKRPICINCALKASGIRGSKRTRPPRKVRKAQRKVAKQADRQRVAAGRRAEEVAAQEAAMTDADPSTTTQQGWVSLDASRWDVGAI